MDLTSNGELLFVLSKLNLPICEDRVGNSEVWLSLLNALNTRGFLKFVQFHGRYGPWPESVMFQSLEEVASAAANSRCGAWTLSSEMAENPRFQVLMWVRKRGIQLQIAIRSLQGNLIQRLTKLIQGLLAAFPEAVMGPEAVLLARHVPIPRARPPRRLTGRNEAVAYWYDSRFVPTREHHKHTRQRHLAEFAPTYSVRSETERLISVQWTDKTGDRAALSQALGHRQRWLSSVASGAIEEGYNELGDLNCKPQLLKPHKPLSGYNPADKRGYKKIPNRNGEFHERWLEIAESWIKAGQLPDGSPLAELWLLSSTREDAIRLKPIADKIGAAGSLWIDVERDALWNPFPPGPWLKFA